MKDPGRYLQIQELEFACAVEPGKKAQIIPAMRERVNHEFFYFSSSKAKDTFQKNPVAYVGKLTDPVTHERFEPDADSPKLVFEGRRYFFSSNESREKFLEKPENYWERPASHTGHQH